MARLHDSQWLNLGVINGDRVMADLQLFLTRISSSILPGIDPAIQGVRRDRFDGFHLLKGRHYSVALDCDHM